MATAEMDAQLWEPTTALRCPETFYEVAYRKWQQQQADNEAIDRKALGLFTVASVMLTGVLAVVRLRSSDLSYPLIFVGAMGVVFFLVTLYCILAAVRLKEFGEHPDSEDIFRYAEGRDDAAMKVWLGAMYIKACDENQPVYNEKTNSITLAWTWLGLEVSTLAVTLLVSFF